MRPPSDTAGRETEIRRLERVAGLLDTAFGIPGTRISIGLDGILGLLLPGLGDGMTALGGLWIIWRARRIGAPLNIIFKMLLNVAVDLTVGAVPVLGDLFDFVWKANRRNVTLLRKYFADVDADHSPKKETGR